MTQAIKRRAEIVRIRASAHDTSKMAERFRMQARILDLAGIPDNDPGLPTWAELATEADQARTSAYRLLVSLQAGLRQGGNS